MDNAPFDIFMCHRGGRDLIKWGVAASLTYILRELGFRVFFDALEIGCGNGTEQMAAACHKVKWAVVLFSRGFFESRWTVKELRTFAKREEKERAHAGLIIPIMIGVEKDDVAKDCQRYWPGVRERQYRSDKPRVYTLVQSLTVYVKHILSHPGVGLGRVRQWAQQQQLRGAKAFTDDYLKQIVLPLICKIGIRTYLTRSELHRRMEKGTYDMLDQGSTLTPEEETMFLPQPLPSDAGGSMKPNHMAHSSPSSSSKPSPAHMGRLPRLGSTTSGSSESLTSLSSAAGRLYSFDSEQKLRPAPSSSSQTSLLFDDDTKREQERVPLQSNVDAAMDLVSSCDAWYALLACPHVCLLCVFSRVRQLKKHTVLACRKIEDLVNGDHSVRKTSSVRHPKVHLPELGCVAAPDN